VPLFIEIAGTRSGKSSLSSHSDGSSQLDKSSELRSTNHKGKPQPELTHHSPSIASNFYCKGPYRVSFPASDLLANGSDVCT